MSDGTSRRAGPRGVVVLVVVVALTAVRPANVSGQVSVACEGVEAWAAGLALTWQGAPVSCEGGADSEFDGSRFGSVEVGFRNGLVFAVRTFAPEGSVTRVRLEDGFDDPDLVLAAARDHAEGFGLRVDWSLPDVSTEEGLRVERYWDPEPGLNASVSLLWDAARLVEVRITAAP